MRSQPSLTQLSATTDGSIATAELAANTDHASQVAVEADSKQMMVSAEIRTTTRSAGPGHEEAAAAVWDGAETQMPIAVLVVNQDRA